MCAENLRFEIVYFIVTMTKNQELHKSSTETIKINHTTTITPLF